MDQVAPSFARIATLFASPLASDKLRQENAAAFECVRRVLYFAA
jgi:hypothetical protein